jgi:hypothetical protein
MNAYLITYEFKKGFDPEFYLPALSEQLKSFPGWWHYISNVWIVTTSLPAADIYNSLLPLVGASANLLVVSLGDEYWGWLPDEAHRWLRLNVLGEDE